jgi:hypothetical protein
MRQTRVAVIVIFLSHRIPPVKSASDQNHGDAGKDNLSKCKRRSELFKSPRSWKPAMREEDMLFGPLTAALTGLPDSQRHIHAALD